MRRRSSLLNRHPFATITFDKSISDPANISGDINQGIIAEILSKFRRCLVKKTTDGEVTIAYLDNQNSNYYEDGTIADLTGSEGDVMVYMPEFYYKYEKIDGNRFSYHLSHIKRDANYIKVPESLVGAYEAFHMDGKLYSRSGVVSSSYITQVDFKAYAAARGNGYRIIDYQQHCTIAMMFYAKYGTRDSQSILGTGADSYSIPQGTSNMRGIRDTMNETVNLVNFLGIEAVHGGKSELMEGIRGETRLWTVLEPDGTDRPFPIESSYSSGWIQNMQLEEGPYFDLIPLVRNLSGQNMYYTDYFNISTSHEFITARSYTNTSPWSGVSYISTFHENIGAYISYGSRLSFRGKISETASISEFKHIPITG